MADGSEVVDLVGLGLLDRLDQRGLVGQVRLDQRDIGELVDHRLAAGVALPADQAEDLIALLVEQLGEVSTVLPGDPRDEGSLGSATWRSFLRDAAHA